MSITLMFVFFVSLTLRILVSHQVAPSFDVYGHMCFVKYLREQRSGPFGNITLKLVGASGYSQPFMWHWLIGMFNINMLFRNQAWLNGVIDALFVAIAFMIVQWSGYSEKVAIYAVAIYLLTPMWFSSIAIGPRIAGFTPRLSSEVATNLFFIICLLPIGLSVLQIITFGGLIAAFILSTSKFGVQALLFLTPIVSLFSGSLLPLEALVAGLTLTIAASRGKIFVQLRAQVTHLAWYCRENIKRKMYISDRNNFRILFRRTEPSLKKYLFNLIYRIVSTNSYTSVAVKLPVIFLAAFGLVHFIVAEGDSSESTIAAPIFAALLLYFVVNLRPFLFLGEAERYLNHVAFFIALFAAIYALGNGLQWLLLAISAYGMVYLAIESFALERLKPNHIRQRQDDGDHLIEYLQAQPTAVVLCYPYHAAGGIYRIMLETRHSTIFCIYTSKEFSENFNAKYADDYPFVKLEKLDDMADAYGISFIILDSQKMQARGYEDWVPSSQWVKKAIGGEGYHVYQRGSLTDGDIG